MKFLRSVALAFIFFISSCQKQTFSLTSGSADFSTFIAVGDSQTAGYANNGLYNAGIMASFPSVMAMQMAPLGGDAFTQPLFGSSQANGSGYLQFNGYTNAGLPNISRVTSNLATSGYVYVPNYGYVVLYTKYQGLNNNFGITGIKLADINNANLGNTNGYFERLLVGSSPNNTITYYTCVTAQPHTFFSCWLGNNDILNYASAGGASDSLTSKSNFNALYQSLINKLTANKQKGVVATIPDVSVFPYFNIITLDSIAKSIKASGSAFSGLYINARNSSDPNSTSYSARLAASSDLFVSGFDVTTIGAAVASANGLPYGLTAYTPVDNQYVLDQNEIALVRDYTAAYNASIAAIAQAKGLAVFDVYTYLNQLKRGLTINGIKLNTSFITGGVFSLDGIHLTPRGYALLANGFDKAINTQYGSGLLQVDIS